MSDLDGLKLLRQIEEGVAGKYGEAFFRQIVCELARALGAHASFAARLNPDNTASMLAFWVGDRFDICTTYELDGTPCQFVYEGRITAYARDIGRVFPVDREWFESMGVNSYLGIPIKGETGRVFGHMTVMDRRERDWKDADVDVLRLFSLRTAVELERDASHRQLQSSNRALAAANAQLSDEIRQRLRVEEALAGSKRSAEAASQAKSVFISQMSHELRTPLNGIMGYAQLMRRSAENLSPQQRDGLRVIERSGEHLLALVNDLLDLAKIEAGKVELTPAETDVDEVADQVRELIEERARSSQIGFTVSNMLAPGTLWLDARALRQALLNLVNNAVKFTKPGGQVHLRIRSEGQEGPDLKITFEVEDSGVGIPAEELQRIFDPFHRVSDPRRSAEGTGLGLTITQRLVEAMGGRLQVSSQVGVGSLFSFSLTLKKSSQVMLSPAPLPLIRGYAGARRRVLLADDDAVGRGLVSSLLHDLGFAVSVAEDGAEALRAVRAQPPDLLITDLIMPRVDGIELAQTLRRSAAAKGIKILALSASTALLNERSIQLDQFDAVLKKPVRFESLLDTIQGLLGLSWEREVVETLAASKMMTAESEAAIRAQLTDLARRGDVTALADLLAQYAPRSAGLDALRRDLGPHIDCFDTASIRRTLGLA